MESTTGEEAENDSVSACTQKIESGGDTGVQQSGSEQEGPISDDTNAEGASACVKPTGLSVQEHCPPTTETELSHSNQIQTANEVAPPPEPAKVVTTSISGSESPQDNCFSTDDSQRKLLCSTPSPEHSGLSTNGASPVINLITKGASAPVRPTSLKLRPKHCPPSIRRGELSHPNQNSNTKGARRPTSLNLHIEHCPPSTGRGELSHPNQIAMNLDTKGACPRPASLNLRIEHRAPSTGRDELSRPNRNSINEGEQIGPTSLDHQKHCPPPTERDSNQIQMADKVASLPEPANVVVISTSTPGGSASAKSANAANQTDSLGIGSSPVLEQVYRNVDLDACGHASEHLHGRQGLQLSRVDPLSIIPEEIQSEDHTRYQSSPSYISSSECTSSIYSSAQGTNGGVGYLADIEDMDSTSLQSDLESDEGTKDDPNKLNGENRKECEPESIQDMIQRLLHHSIPPRVQWYNKKHQPLQDHFLSEDDSEVDYIYIATIPPVDLPDSPCSELGYIVLPQTAELSEDDDEDTFGLEDEVTARPAHTDTPNSGYISSGPQTEICDDVQPVPA